MLASRDRRAEGGHGQIAAMRRLTGGYPDLGRLLTKQGVEVTAR